jgi:hypothetical protein
MPLDLQKSPNREEHRRRQRFPANSSSYSSTTSSQVIIEIPVQSEVIDMETAYLKFDIVAVDTGAGNGALTFQDFAASSWIKDLRVYDFAGNQIGDNINHYNGLFRMLAEMKSNNEANVSYLDALEGANASAAADAETSRQYCHSIRTHIFGLKDYFPANKMGGLRIEIDMEQGHQVAVSDTNEDVDYTVSNLEFVCDLIKLKDEVERALDSQIASSGGFEIHYESYVNRLSTITGSSTTVNLGVLNGALKDVQAIMIQDDERTATVDYWDNWSQNGLTSYRFKLGSQYLTESTVSVSTTQAAEYLMEYLKSQKIDPFSLVGDSGLDGDFLANRFCLGQRADRSNDPDELSSVRDNQQNRLEIELNFSGGDAAALYTFSHLDKRLIIMNNRQFKNQ